ncbi:hypothetical protein LENED_011193 [Lentinula edodes]|uniref:RING-type domain-containing protein n=1 Tax=Lentinula edodes TaxID=5353 RepID=A0A1Q3EPM4_LENED|nr:hypothetical protein LENED_011193 [Lentinula edodes]
MLIVHPSSCCDVCLDPYSWQEETTLKEPYAIPCGHIFCKECLERTATATCPLCRKRFNRDSIKKLHMDALPGSDDSLIVQKLIMAWDDEVEVVNTLEEVERWLQNQESPALTQLRKVQADFQKLKERKAEDRFRIKRLETSLMHLQRSNVHDRDMGLAMEASFSTTIEELETTLQQSQSEVQSLRNQLARLEFSRRDKGKGKARVTDYTSENDSLRHNPLPAPPMAITMERYATVAGDIRSSSVEAEQVAAAIEASIHDRRGWDGSSSDLATSSAGAGSSRPRDTNGLVAPGLASAMPHTPEVVVSSQHYMEPPANYHFPSYLTLPFLRRNNMHRALRRLEDTESFQALPKMTESMFRPVPANTGLKPAHRRHTSMDESFEERRAVDPQAAFASGYTEGLNSGFSARARTTPGPPVSAPLPRSVRFNGATESAIPPATASATTSNGDQQALRRGTTTTQPTTQSITPESLANRLRDLMEDPLRSSSQAQAQHFANNRASAVPSETPTWGTVTTANSSRRQSNASDVMANLRGFPEHAHHSSRASLASSQEIPVGDPRAFLPVIPVNANNPNRPSAVGTNEVAGFSAPVVSSSARSDVQTNNHAITHHDSETPTASRAAPRGNVSQVSQSAGTGNTRPVNQRYTSLPVNTVNTTPRDNTRNYDHARGHRPQSLRPIPTSNLNSNPLPTLPNFGYPSSALASAPHRPAFPEYNSAPAIPMAPVTHVAPNGGSVSGPSRASRDSNSQTPHSPPPGDVNALGLDLNEVGDYDDGRGYEPEPIPAFAAPTPRASHNLFLRSFSFDHDGNEVDGTLYR